MKHNANREQDIIIIIHYKGKIIKDQGSQMTWCTSGGKHQENSMRDVVKKHPTASYPDKRTTESYTASVEDSCVTCNKDNHVRVQVILRITAWQKNGSCLGQLSVHHLLKVRTYRKAMLFLPEMHKVYSLDVLSHQEDLRASTRKIRRKCWKAKADLLKPNLSEDFCYAVLLAEGKGASN